MRLPGFDGLRTLLVGSTLGLSLLIPALSHAEDQKIAFAFTPTAAVAGAFNGIAEGFFAQRGLDVSLLGQANSTGVVAAVQAGDSQIAAAAAGVFFGAVEHGLDYVAFGCQTTFGPGSDVLGVIVRNGVDIKQPSDFLGKRVAVPGLNGGTHVTFMEWLRENNIDRNGITMVEVNYPQQADVLRGTTVDAVVTSEPYMTRITDAGLGTVFSHLNDIELSIPDAFYFTSREWADAHPDAVQAFKDGLAEGVNFAVSNPEKSDENTATALKQDVAFVKAAGRQNFCKPDVDVSQYLDQLNTVMLGLGLTKAPLDVDKVAWKHP